MWGRVTPVYNGKTILEALSDFPFIVYLHIIPRYVCSFQRDNFCLPPSQNAGQPEEIGVKRILCLLTRKWFIYLLIRKCKLNWFIMPRECVNTLQWNNVFIEELCAYNLIIYDYFDYYDYYDNLRSLQEKANRRIIQEAYR